LRSEREDCGSGALCSDDRQADSPSHILIVLDTDKDAADSEGSMAFYDDLGRDPKSEEEFWTIVEETFVQVEGVLATYLLDVLYPRNPFDVERLEKK
jgi:hypothetical protein